MLIAIALKHIFVTWGTYNRLFPRFPHSLASTPGFECRDPAMGTVFTSLFPEYEIMSDSNQKQEHPLFVRWVNNRAECVSHAILIVMIITLPFWVRVLEVYYRFQEWRGKEQPHNK